MSIISKKRLLTIILLYCFATKINFSVCYKTEIELTPSPIEDYTTKKSSFFGGFKKFFGSGSSSTTTPRTTTKRALPPLVISPLMPIGPRPDTPSITPLADNALPNFPTFGGQPSPSKSKPTGLELSYGKSTTTSTVRSEVLKDNIPTSRKPSLGKEDFPALPTPKSIMTSTQKNNLPSAWNSPNIPNSEKFLPALPSAQTSSTTNIPAVSFIPHSSTTVRPGFVKTTSHLATDIEIMELTENLFSKENGLLHLITVNEQGKTRSIDTTDEALQPLLNINSQALDTPTIAKMRMLFNNYESDTVSNEYVTPLERKEENDFVDVVLSTPIMRQTMIFLQKKGVVTADPKTHRDLLKEIWFTQYSRGAGKIGSSGFEHVFVHEVKNNTIIGFHNWIYFGEEELAGRLDYKGYLKEISLGSKAKVLKLRFTYNNLSKPVNSMFIGTSPELELALYTVCFKLMADQTCPISLGNNKFGLVTYSWRYRGKNLIGSAFPEI